MRTRAIRLSPFVAAWLLVCGCHVPLDPLPPAGSDPRSLALELFEVARRGEPDEAELRRLFDAETVERQGVALLDAWPALVPDGAVRVLRIELLAEDRAVADLEVPLAGGAVGSFSVDMARRGAGDWEIRWFGGPGVDWPPAVGDAGSGLQTSAPPP